ncbi:uncharacterized protein B0J16DRAFT_368621 [Fusarium flagelliforme]|uniref:uncharacterized protein n=1 Tax=Fusarium flagelliforme TaxID=2675880 RepID=UPI001E8D4486|nr:uncharacterized protein B0J16DRAFT_368621 [Fusarium flagelliforme]KAH7192369.1 hypothetical protein B0J16DRAFT_368621 [Fusarium flagelliforme]
MHVAIVLRATCALISRETVKNNRRDRRTRVVYMDSTAWTDRRLPKQGYMHTISVEHPYSQVLSRCRFPNVLPPDPAPGVACAADTTPPYNAHQCRIDFAFSLFLCFIIWASYFYSAGELPGVYCLGVCQISRPRFYGYPVTMREREREGQAMPARTLRRSSVDRKYYPALGVDPALGRRMQYGAIRQTCLGPAGHGVDMRKVTVAKGEKSDLGSIISPLQIAPAFLGPSINPWFYRDQVVLDPFITDLTPEVSKDKGSTAANSHLTTQGFKCNASPGQSSNYRPTVRTRR